MTAKLTRFVSTTLTPHKGIFPRRGKTFKVFDSTREELTSHIYAGNAANFREGLGCVKYTISLANTGLVSLIQVGSI